MDRALSEFRIRGVKTNIPFLENVVSASDTFRDGQAHTKLIDTTPELFQFRLRQDRATKLLNYLGQVIVNGNPPPRAGSRRSRLAAGAVCRIPRPSTDADQSVPKGTRDVFC